MTVMRVSPDEVNKAEGKPVEEEAPAVGYRIVLPPARHIPLTVNDVVESMRQQVPHAQRAIFEEICQIVEGLAITEFSSIRRRVKKNFRFFSQAAMKRDIPTRRGRGLKKEETMDEMEVVFLADFWELMDYAHYTALSEADWLAIKQERLMLDMPLTINWDHMDTRLLERFFKRRPQRLQSLYRHHERCLLFHRGVGVIRKKDLFIMEKVDLLVKYLVAWPAKQVFYKIAPHLPKSFRDKAEAMKQKDHEKTVDPNSVTTREEAEEHAEEAAHKNANAIQRVSLRLLLPTWRDVLRNIATPLEIVEPTYKDIITLYRKKIKAPTEKELKADPGKAEAFRRDQRGIVVKRFDEVPVADVEIVFPDKSVGLKLIDLLTLYGTAIGAFIGGVTAFFGAQLELSYVLSTLGVVGGKLFQTYTKMEAKKAEMMKQMAQTVFDISMDAQEGAIYSVLDEMADQYVKEILLAYFLLIKYKYPCTEGELDEVCEAFLEDKFDVRIDFAIEESMPRLRQYGLVDSMPDPDDPRFKAPDLETAHARLIKRWQRAFSVGDEGLSTLTGGAAIATGAIGGVGSASIKAIGSVASGITSVLPGTGKSSGTAKKKHWWSKSKAQ
eukprot:jgi/Ulvmu1/750/UM010_0124.1